MIFTPLKLSSLQTLIPIRLRRASILTSLVIAAVIAGGFSNTAGSQGIAELSLLAATVADLQDKLDIREPIEVVLVERDDYAVSVARHPDNRRQFRIRFERAFLNLLTADEIRAALAHELGHIWIFTHHPYLQTEELANRVAGKAVNTAELDRIKTKSADYLNQRNRTAEEAASSR